MNLLSRNYAQVKNADAIFAVGQLNNGIVDGGTGWAV
nr:MAG TPA: YspA [Caudoviricetes sp.]